MRFFIKKNVFFCHRFSKMNKSFLYGIIIASLTWSISFFLYWTLTQSDDYQKNSSSPPGWSDSPLTNKINQELILESNLLGDGDTKLDEKSRYFIMDKESRYRKEKKFRKISHKLIEEMRPVFPKVPKGAAGKIFLFI